MYWVHSVQSGSSAQTLLHEASASLSKSTRPSPLRSQFDRSASKRFWVASLGPNLPAMV